MSWLLPPNKVTIRPTLWLHHGRAIACPTRRVGTSVPVIAGQDDFLLLFMAFRSSSQVSKDCLMRTSALETDDKNLACSSCARGILSPLHQCKGISRRGLIYKNGRSQRLQINLTLSSHAAGQHFTRLSRLSVENSKLRYVLKILVRPRMTVKFAQLFSSSYNFHRHSFLFSPGFPPLTTAPARWLAVLSLRSRFQLVSLPLRSPPHPR